MIKIIFRLLFIFLLGVVMPLNAQSDGFDLPTDLYILLNEGLVQRYGLGIEGATTITPDGEFIIDFAVAPDGNWMAYRTESGITLAYMPNPNRVRVLLETATSADFPPLRQGGQTMTWSADGTQLAYTTTYGVRVAFNLGTNNVVFAVIITSPARHLAWSADGTFLAIEVENNIWWIYRRVGDDMVLAGALPSSYGTAWQGDSRLIFAPSEGGLLIIDLDNFNEQYPLRNDGQRYFLPYLRPDGDMVVFSAPINAGDAGLEVATWTRLTLAGNIATVAEVHPTPMDIRGAMWAIGGDLLISLAGADMTLLIPQADVRLPLPVGEVVAYGWGAERPPSARGVIMNRPAFFLAPDFFGVMQVWQLPNNGMFPIQLTYSEDETSVVAYAVNPIGTQIAFVRDNRLWWLPIDVVDDEEIEPMPLTRQLADGDVPQEMVFSPDDTQIFYTTLGNDGGLWAVDVNGDSIPRLLLPNEPDASYVRPRFAPNINALIIGVVRDERPTQYLFYDPVAQDALNIGSYEVAGWLPDGRVVGYTSISTGLASLQSQLQTLNLFQDPILPTMIWNEAQMRLLDFQPISAERWLMVVSDVLPYGAEPVRLLEYANGTFSIKVTLNTLIAPVISPDGLFLASLTRPNGLLIIHDLTTGERTLLKTPTGIQDFRWLGADGDKFN